MALAPGESGGLCEVRGVIFGALDRAKAEPIGLVVPSFDLAANLERQFHRGGRHL